MQLGIRKEAPRVNHVAHLALFWPYPDKGVFFRLAAGIAVIISMALGRFMHVYYEEFRLESLALVSSTWKKKL